MKLLSFVVFLLFFNYYEPLANSLADTIIQPITDCTSKKPPFEAHQIIPHDTMAQLVAHVNLIWMLRDDGTGGWSTENEKHKKIFLKAFDTLNTRLANLTEYECNCDLPFRADAGIRFLPHFVNVASTYYWNDNNDNQQSTWNSRNKKFLNKIVSLASKQDGFKANAFNVIYTVAGDDMDQFDQDTTVPIWKYHSPNYQGNAYSAFPDTRKLDRKVMMHMPNAYSAWYNGLIHLSDNYERDWHIGHASGLLHEMLHYFGLSHPSPHCTKYSNGTYTDSINIMNKSGSKGRNSLTTCQIKKMWTTLMYTNLRQIVDCETSKLYDLYINESMTLSNDLYIYGDIVIADSVELRFTCNIHLAKGCAIRLGIGSKLILDGAMISSFSHCKEQWDGIHLNSESVHPQVVMQNGGRIENAKFLTSVHEEKDDEKKGFWKWCKKKKDK